MASVLRIVDANANRAREAMRVMEDAARFILDDAELAAALKTLRHDLRHALESADAVRGAIAWRDAVGDVGATISTPGEQHRGSSAQVAIAAGKRLSEALRSLEEYAKVLTTGRDANATASAAAPSLAGAIEALRYRAYDLERRLNLAMMGGAGRQWRLCVLVSETLCPGGDWEAVTRAAIDGGADCIQLREKTLPDLELLARARRLVELCRPRGVSAIVNDRPDIALLADADGVHLGQDDLPCDQVRRLVGDRLLIGVSTSNLEQAVRALRDGSDYCGVGPMFPTATKRKDVIVGPAYLREFLAWGRLPHLAIGGIGPDNVDDLVAVGVRGIAVSACVCTHAQPADVCRTLVDRLTPHPA